jgi:hypothetical protein
MAEGYAMSKTLGYSTEYMQRFQGTIRRVWDDKEENNMIDEIVQGNGWPMRMSQNMRAWAYNFVINNSIDMVPWRL